MSDNLGPSQNQSQLNTEVSFFWTINQCILFLTMQAFLQFVLGGPRRFSDTTLSPLFVQSIKGHKT